MATTISGDGLTIPAAQGTNFSVVLKNGQGVYSAPVAGAVGTVLTSTGSTASFQLPSVTQPPFNQIPASAALQTNTTNQITSVAPISVSLPTTAALGSIIRVNFNTQITTITQAALQSIIYLGQTSTVGTGGSLQSSGTNGSITMQCITANTTFQVIEALGTCSVT